MIARMICWCAGIFLVLGLAGCTGTVKELKSSGQKFSFTTKGNYDQIGQCYHNKQQAHSSSVRRAVGGGGVGPASHEFHNSIDKLYRVSVVHHTPYGSKPYSVVEFRPAGEGMTNVTYYRIKRLIDLGSGVEGIKSELVDCQQYYQQ